ncbi:hypothetical protein CWI38_0309p0020 [Hamiltosporidium tvaerminnensis]|uniref:WH2 domain-containing protein n=1 Tax=Hamiltosporidium tvaerminnensis TaxID=1176355 RepID=A0A4Q9LYF4_9MICR|nr:hypothetical protein CWI38_0309p0020 [Hamiltosporidium tvaerminnensis]
MIFKESGFIHIFYFLLLLFDVLVCTDEEKNKKSISNDTPVVARISGHKKDVSNDTIRFKNNEGSNEHLSIPYKCKKMIEDSKRIVKKKFNNFSEKIKQNFSSKNKKKHKKVSYEIKIEPLLSPTANFYGDNDTETPSSNKPQTPKGILKEPNLEYKNQKKVRFVDDLGTNESEIISSKLTPTYIENSIQNRNTPQENRKSFCPNCKYCKKCIDAAQYDIYSPQDRDKDQHNIHGKQHAPSLPPNQHRGLSSAQNESSNPLIYQEDVYMPIYAQDRRFPRPFSNAPESLGTFQALEKKDYPPNYINQNTIQRPLHPPPPPPPQKQPTQEGSLSSFNQTSKIISPPPPPPPPPPPQQRFAPKHQKQSSSSLTTITQPTDVTSPNKNKIAKDDDALIEELKRRLVKRRKNMG